jgi:Mrp family chromosome partitioning ATPase
MSTETAKPGGANETCVAGTPDAGKASSCDGCPNQSACASGVPVVDPAVAAVAARLRGVRHTVLVLSGKGGVGKSTFSAQLAFTLAARGRSVGLLDIDICGPSIPRMLGLTQAKVHQSASGWSPVWLHEALGVMSIGFMLPGEDDAVIWRGPRKNGIIRTFLSDVDWGELDYLIIDTPPGTSDEHISTVQFLKETAGVEGAVVVTTPQEVAMADVRKELNFCKKVGLRVLGVVENMSGFICPCCGHRENIFSASGDKAGAEAGAGAGAGSAGGASADSGGPRAMAERFEVPFLGALPIDPLLLRACEAGESYVVKHPKAAGVAAFLSVIGKVVEQCEGEGAKLDDPDAE